MQSAPIKDIGKGRIRLSLSVKRGGSGKEHAKGKIRGASRREVDALSRPFGAPSPAKRDGKPT